MAKHTTPGTVVPFIRLGRRGSVLASAFLGFLLAMTAPASAQDSGAVQRITGSLSPDEALYFQINGLRQGQTLYVHADNTSGNLDPFLALVAGDTDVALLRQQFAQNVEALLAAGVGPIVAANETAAGLSLAWNDDLENDHAAGFSFEVPADGDYLLLLRSTLARSTFGGYNLLVGLDAPDVLTGKATPTAATLAVKDEESSTQTSAPRRSDDFIPRPRNPGLSSPGQAHRRNL